MRHRKKINHLGRKAEHRKAMLSNLAVSLIMHKRIKTTVAKAKALRVFIEPIITRAKRDRNQTKEQYTHNMRMAFRRLRNKQAVKELFGIVSERVGDRPGGYTRILKVGRRVGDAAPMAYIELVDFNTTYNIDKEAKATKKRRRRRGGKKKTSPEAAATATTTQEVKQSDEVKEITPDKQEVQDKKDIEQNLQQQATDIQDSSDTPKQEDAKQNDTDDKSDTPDNSDNNEQTEDKS